MKRYIGLCGLVLGGLGLGALWFCNAGLIGLGLGERAGLVGLGLCERAGLGGLGLWALKFVGTLVIAD